MAKPPVFLGPPAGDVRVEVPDGITWSRGNETRSNVYDNNRPFDLPSPNFTTKPQRQR